MLEALKNTEILSNLSKSQNRMVAFLAGAIASFALPPAGIWPTLFIAFSTLVLLLDAIDRRSISRTQKFWAAFVCGWQFGFGYFVVSLYWIGAAFLVDADKFAILLPFAVAVLPAGIALFWGLATGFAILAWQTGLHRILVLAVFLTAFEWIRGHVLTGFPWNTVGYTSAGMGDIDQLASISGLYGVTFFVFICAMAPALFFSKQKNITLAGFLLVSYVALWFGGIIFQSHANNTATGPIIRIVQPNIEQRKKWAREFAKENIETYFRLSRSKPTNLTIDVKHFDALIWPESALPLVIDENPALKARIAALLPSDSVLIMGALRHHREIAEEKPKSKFFNSVLAFDSHGQIIATYDKSHLVPFGEYLPGEKWLTPLGLRKIVALPGGFSSGSGPQTLRAGKLPPFSALVCYEIGFPGQVVNQQSRPKWIVNVTNDGWFGKTAGPYQHLAQARFRAIEQGLPVVRAANTGISAVIDPHGKIVASLGLGKSGTIQVTLPSSNPNTVYSRYGDWAAVVQIVGMLIILSFVHGLINRQTRLKTST